MMKGLISIILFLCSIVSLYAQSDTLKNRYKNVDELNLKLEKIDPVSILWYVPKYYILSPKLLDKNLGFDFDIKQSRKKILYDNTIKNTKKALLDRLNYKGVDELFIEDLFNSDNVVLRGLVQGLYFFLGTGYRMQLKRLENPNIQFVNGKSPGLFPVPTFGPKPIFDNSIFRSKSFNQSVYESSAPKPFNQKELREIHEKQTRADEAMDGLKVE